MALPEGDLREQVASVATTRTSINIEGAMADTPTRHDGGPFCESNDPQVPERDAQVRR